MKILIIEGIIIQQRPFLELVQNYSFQLIATDNGIPPLSSTATVNVVLYASNVYPPVFDKVNEVMLSMK